MSDAVIAQEVSKVFRLPNAQKCQALKNINITMAKGCISMIVGPDGAGKTTFLRLCAGLMAPSAGNMTVLGFKAGYESTSIEEHVSYMPQKFGLYEDLSVDENMRLYASLYGVTGDEYKKRADLLLGMTDMARFKERLAGKLSGGMKQKLGLACTMLSKPQLLVLDEPCVGVDPLSRTDLWKIIRDMVKNEGTTVIVSTAYLDEAMFADRVFVFDEGEVLTSSIPEALAARALGRTWRLEPSTNTPSRVTQAELLEHLGVTDAVPCAGSINVTLDAGVKPDDIFSKGSHFFHSSAISMTSRSPGIEDGFMALFKEKKGHGPELSSAVPPLSYDKSKSELVIEVRDLLKTFGSFTAVDHTSFEVRRGEIFGLLGPNGAGKTTTFRMLCGLIPASGGTLNVAGFDLHTARDEARKHVGYVAQKFSLYADLSVLENLQFFGGVYGLRGKELKKRISEVMEEFELSSRAHDKSGELPGGFKQRLSMAVGTIHHPEILFLDEPTSGTDPIARRVFWHRITGIAQTGTTIIVTTHFLEESEYCDRIMIQDAGRMIALGTPSEVRKLGGETPEHPLTMEQVFINTVLKARGKGNSCA